MPEESLPTTIRRRLEAGEKVSRSDFPGVNPHTWQGALSRLRDKRRCGAGLSPLVIVYDKDTKSYSLHKGPA